MQEILTCAMGLDIHRDIIVACLAKGELGSGPEMEIRSFSTLIPEMKKLRDWILEVDCRRVAMESTGIYWQPIYEMLEPCFDGEINIPVVNARHRKNVPGRRTDMRDAQWIATLLRAFLLKGSLIPDKAFREPQHLTRYRKSIVHDITAQKNRLDKFLQSCGFRVTAFLSDAFGASWHNIIRHLIQDGSIDRAALDKCLKTQTRKRIDQILIALNGNLSIHQRSFLLSPGNNESAGKCKSAHIYKGNPYLKSMLCEVGWVISGKRTLYLSGWYWRIKQRKGAKRATIALARKRLTLIYSMLKAGQPYNKDCFEQRRKRCERKRAHRMVNELQKLGYMVISPN
ncbi:MAG: IS110 family transposase [Oscillospiraceae bacterium]|nr:IS110 family transposase [Oscillospiraceae bacterium]MCI8525374.1 IS110 family transposase [Oscillospiraceae bacterium]